MLRLDLFRAINTQQVFCMILTHSIQKARKPIVETLATRISLIVECKLHPSLTTTSLVLGTIVSLPGGGVMIDCEKYIPEPHHWIWALGLERSVHIRWCPGNILHLRQVHHDFTIFVGWKVYLSGMLHIPQCAHCSIVVVRLSELIHSCYLRIVAGEPFQRTKP